MTMKFFKVVNACSGLLYLMANGSKARHNNVWKARGVEYGAILQGHKFTRQHVLAHVFMQLVM